MKNTRKLFSIINITVLLFVACSCNYTNTTAIDSGLRKIIKTLKKEGPKSSDLLIIAKSIQNDHKVNFTKIDHKEKLVGIFNNEDSERAKEWMRTNEQVISDVLIRINSEIENDISEINQLSKDAYEEQDNIKSIWKYALTYFRLQYLRHDIRKSIEVLSPLTLIIHSAALENDTASLELRKKIEEKILTMIGVGIVVDQDYNQIKSIIKNFNDSNLLPESLKNILVKTDVGVIKDMNIHAKKFRVTKGDCLKNSTDERCIKILEAKAAILMKYSNISFLFTPGQKYFLITKLLTLIGNLTWGLANTIIGAGVVLAAIAVSPFTRYVDLPSFKLSKSGMQIYVDVTGMSPIPGKMSLGLFELDNASSFDFASHHEAGHAIQSALLGPFYLPVVLITYLISGFDSGLMEDLADSAASASDKWL